MVGGNRNVDELAARGAQRIENSSIRYAKYSIQPRQSLSYNLNMEIIFLLIPLSLTLVGLAVWAFFWATKSGQFDDLDSPALSILEDDDVPPNSNHER